MTRNKKGQFVKGERSHPETEFKPGQHWRPRKEHWDAEWLRTEYVVKGRSTGDIAKQQGCTDANILFWLRKHGIEARTISAARDKKHWGAARESNPMYGKRGSLSRNWKGGCTPERQAVYSSIEWADAVKAVWLRDNSTCQRCGKKSENRRVMNVHHIISFAVKELRTDPNNLVLLCSKCHGFVHSKDNTEWEFIREEVTENAGTSERSEDSAGG